ncbi:MAG TPA: hypothetical protein VF244_03440 [Acidimicrobiales bacterium]
MLGVLLGLAGCSSGRQPVAGGAGAADPTPPQVSERPWPARATPGGPWSASMHGVGPRLTVTTGGTVAGGLARTSVDIGSRALLLPNGERWYPEQPFGVEDEGDVPFGLSRTSPDSGGVYGLSAAGGDLEVAARFDDLMGAGGGDLRVRGDFSRRDGTRVDGLDLPPGTTLAVACEDPAAPPTTSFAMAPCDPDTEGVLTATVAADAGTTVRAGGDGELALAGRDGVTAEAVGRTWTGQVVAVEGGGVDARATFDGRQWSVTATVGDGRQVWVDVWPVIDTILDARSYSVAPGFFDRNRLLKVEWVNVGYATAQVLEAEGVGPGAAGVGFDLNKTLGHDAGLGVRRGDVVHGFGGGGDVDSNLPPGHRLNRELSYDAGQPATLVLRGNFPEVRVDLAVPGT